MNGLEQKYRNDTLTPDELAQLRQQVNAMSDDRLEESLREAWEAAEDCPADGPALDELKKRIDRLAFPPERRLRPLYLKLAGVAAAVLFLLMAGTTAWLYRENRQLSEQDFVCTTGKNEQVTLTLPDGTTVTLNSESKLSYNLSRYRADERRVTFEGEGYFQVAKNPSSPFTVDAKGLQVAVLGTVFNLRARPHDATAELLLEEGSVRFVSLKTGQSVVLSPRQKAILYREPGTLAVDGGSDAVDASAWKRGELVFRNVPLGEVLQTLEEVYGMTFVMEAGGEAYREDLFTGVLSRTDINEALEVIERSYHLTATLKDGTVRLSASR